MSLIQPITDPDLKTAEELRLVFARDAAARDRAGGRPAEQIDLIKASGLGRLLIPREFGGAGQPWSKALRVVREFAKADGSLAHLYGYHNVASGSVAFLGSPEQQRRLLIRTAQENLFWGNSANSLSKSLFGRREKDFYILNGHRPFSSGSHVADMLKVGWEDERTQESFYAGVPADREGIRVLHDWNGIGQTQTGSGSVEYRDVKVHLSEVYDTAHSDALPISTLIPTLAQNVLTNVFIGSAHGALLEGRDYTTTRSRPWVNSGVERHVDDPWVKRVYGDLLIKLKAAELLADEALHSLDALWQVGRELTWDRRGENAVISAAANVHAGQVALEVTSKVFEVTGARSATTDIGLDRFWRNVRIHSLHNPEEYKTRTVGDWFLFGNGPQPGAFR